MRTFLMIFVVTLLLSACGSTVDDVPSLEATPTAVVEKVIDDETKVMAFTQCMRDAGIEYKDPMVDSTGNVQQPELAEGVSYFREVLGAAYAGCEDHLEGLTFGRERKDVSGQLDHFLELVTCLRDKGYELDDPTAETLNTWLIDFRVEFDWTNEDATADYEECNTEN